MNSVIISHTGRRVAIVVLTKRGLKLAKKLSLELPNSEIHGHKKRIETADKTFSDTMAHLRYLFNLGSTIIGICATGILVRGVSSKLKGKDCDPPVISISEDGKSIVPILGGHNGANLLANFLSKITKGHAAITTASDSAFGISLDEPPKGWHLANPQELKRVMAELLSGEKITLDVLAGDVSWILDSNLPISDSSSLILRVTEKSISESDSTLTYHPPVLSLGLGCERGVEVDEVINLVKTIIKESGFAPDSIACVASLDLKMDEPAIHAAAEFLGVPARFYSAEEIELESCRLANPSAEVFAVVGCHGVCEGAALRASGKNGVLVVEKTKSPRATVAVARALHNIHAESCGQARGCLNIVGIGPGQKIWRTADVENVISRCSHVVGYSYYLELIEDLTKGKICFNSKISEERVRVSRAIEFAATGREVALICSGDAGVYALASLVYEVIEYEKRDDWNRISIEIIPGISAFQAAASRIGAPMGHDFCVISLSDLLTSWGIIKQRIKAAAKADFVVAFYNPSSKRRTVQLEKARDILLTFRSRKTPVILARNVGRKDEKLTITTLIELTAGMTDMLTVVIVGSSKSRVINQGGQSKVYTPRGYIT